MPAFVCRFLSSGAAAQLRIKTDGIRCGVPTTIGNLLVQLFDADGLLLGAEDWAAGMEPVVFIYAQVRI